MARFSLLFSLAYSFAFGSLFLSISGHAPPAPRIKSLYTKTVSEVQTLPFTDITSILNRKEYFSPKTAEFKAMFSICKDYVAYLKGLYKLENPIVDVLGISKTKYTLMTKAILAAQASVNGKLDKKTSLKLKKSGVSLAKGFLQVQKTIVKISSKHNYKANEKINTRELSNISNVVLNFKNSIDAFMDVIYDLEKKVNGHQKRKLEEEEVKKDSKKVRNAFENFFKKFSNKFGGYLGGKTHGRELYEMKDFLKQNGGNIRFDAAGKMKVVGKDGFRSLNRAHFKHLVSTKA
ncbi:unnamed protein product [Cochlearia groenlandica]